MNFLHLLKPGVVQVLVVAVAAFGVFANTLLNGFVSDDEQLVLLNPWITDPRYIPEIFSSSAWGFLGDSTRSNYYRPLLHLIYLVDFSLFGLRAWGFHLVNVLFHVANTIVVFVLTARLTGQEHRSTPDSRRRLSVGPLSVPLVAALLFATHPIHTEAVNWVASIQELSFTLLYLLAFHLYIDPRPWSAGRRVASVGCFFLALLCKETALTLPVMLVVYDLALGANEPAARVHHGAAQVDERGARAGKRGRRRTLREPSSTERARAWPGAGAIRGYLPYMLAIAVYAALRHNALSDMVPAAGAHRLSLLHSIINLPPLFARHIEKLLLPVGLSFRHPFHQISSLLTADSALGLAVAAAFAVAAVAAWRRHRLGFLCLALVVVPLLPTFYINALAVNPFAERFLYLPSVGFVILAALFLSRLAGGRRITTAATLVLFGVTTVLYASAAVSRNRVWEDAYTLYFDSAATAPDAPTPPYELTVALLGYGRVDEALAHLRILTQVHPADARYRRALGSALLAKDRVDEAIEHLQAALSMAPASPETHNDLAIALHKSGREQQAIAQYREALQVSPDYAEAHFNLGGALATAGQTAEAMDHYRAAVRLRPQDAYYRNMLGIECGKLGLFDEAIAQFEEALRLVPTEPAYRRNLDKARAAR